MVRFPLEQSYTYIFRLLLAVKSNLMSMPKISFWSFLGQLKDGHRHGVLPAWWVAHHISMKAHFMRWCWSAYLEARFPFLFNPRSFVHVYNPCPHVALYEWSHNQCLDQVTFMAESFLSEARVGNFITTLWNLLLRWDGFGCRPKTIPRLLSFKTLAITALSISLITSLLLLTSVGLY
jgi:hypothetical protein